MSRSWEDWQEIIRPKLEGINRYNPDNMETLEQYAQFQAESHHYDFEANLTLMKLYQFEPHRAVARVAVQILLKALVNMPKPDFSLLKSVLPCNLVSLLLTTYLML
jgi:translation initiation factor 3 subunit K